MRCKKLANKCLLLELIKYELQWRRKRMEFQDVMAIIQSCIGLVSLVISLVTLNKVSQINVEKRDTTYKNQIAIGHNNTQEENSK